MLWRQIPEVVVSGSRLVVLGVLVAAEVQPRQAQLQPVGDEREVLGDRRCLQQVREVACNNASSINWKV